MILHWTYAINGSFEGPENASALFFSNGTQSNGGTFEFQEAYIAKELESGLTLTFGQFKTPWMREELVDSSQQLAVERSAINEFYNQDRAVGIMASYATDSWNVAASYNNGQQTALSQGTRYTNFSNNPTDWALLGLVSSTSSPATGVTSTASPAHLVTKKPSWSAQPSWVRSTASSQTASPLVASISVSTVRPSGASPVTSSAKFGGFSLFGSFVYQSYDFGDGFGPNSDNWNPWGVVVQAGYSLNDEWELFARYEEGNGDPGLPSRTLLTRWC